MSTTHIDTPTGTRRSRRRIFSLAAGAILLLNLVVAGTALANHEGAFAEITIYRGTSVLGNWTDTVSAPGNEVIYVHLWNLGKRDYSRVVKCWGGTDHKEIVIQAGHFNKIEDCSLTGQLHIQTDAHLTGPEMFDTHENDVTVIVTVNALPFGG